MEAVMSFLCRMILLTGFWIAVEHYGKTLILTLFFKFKITNREGFRIVNICCHCVYYSSCILVMLSVLSTSLNVDFPGTVFKYHTFSSDTINLKFEASEIQLLFVLSHYFFRIIETCLTKCFNLVEFSEMFLFACLFLQGCYCGFVGIVLFIGCLTYMFEVLRLVCEISQILNKSYQIKIPFYLSVMLQNIYWLYVNFYMMPIQYIPGILSLKTDEITYASFVALFKILFLLYYIIAISNCPMQTYVLPNSKCARNSFSPEKSEAVQNPKKSHESRQQTEEEATLSMYTAQGKSATEVKKQLALMQTVRCVIALRKKAKRIRERKEKLAEEESRFEDTRNN